MMVAAASPRLSPVLSMSKGRQGCGDRAFERIFITGVSPVTLDDVTSGFNIGWHISTKEEFNQMLGFSTEDVREIFTYYQEKGMIPADRDIEAIINEMKPWYDNSAYPF